MNTKLPTKVKIATHIFSVEEKSTQWSDDTGKLGTCDCMQLIINVCSDFPHSQVYETLLHEIFHAIYWAYNIDDDDKEERVVGTFAAGFTQVLIDNPELIKYLGKKII